MMLRKMIYYCVSDKIIFAMRILFYYNKALKTENKLKENKITLY